MSERKILVLVFYSLRYSQQCYEFRHVIMENAFIVIAAWRRRSVKELRFGGFVDKKPAECMTWNRGM